MTALDVLRGIDSLGTVQDMTLRFNRAKRGVKPYMGIITRVLLISAFVEDGFRTAVEYESHVQFFRRELGIAGWVGLGLIGISTVCTFVGCGLVFAKQTQRVGAQMLVGVVIYQELVYGRHSPITSGNIGFLVRNVCLIGSLLLLMVKQGVKDVLPGLPGLPGLHERGRKDKGRDKVALMTRCMVGLLCVEMLDVVGWGWSVVMGPICICVMIGYKTDLMGLGLCLFYVMAAVTSKQFWKMEGTDRHGVFERDVMRFEFLQTLSILSGVLMLIMAGPGAVSVDEKLRGRKKW